MAGVVDEQIVACGQAPSDLGERIDDRVAGGVLEDLDSESIAILQQRTDRPNIGHRRSERW